MKVSALSIAALAPAEPMSVQEEQSLISTQKRS
jgi:hypothetical protein